MSDWQSDTSHFSLPLNYKIWGDHPDHLVICLHGYQDRAQVFLKRMGWWEKLFPFKILALNGPFPNPIWDEGHIIEAYSWYFRDSSRGQTLIAPETSAAQIAAFIDRIGLNSAKKILLGYSQGGYFAPYLAKNIHNVVGILGVGCGYPFAAYQQLSKLTVHAVHGQNDEIVTKEKSSAEYHEIYKLGFKGTFHSIEGMDHHKLEPAGQLCEKLAINCFNLSTNA